MPSKIETTHWTTDPAAEGLFDRLGVTWEYRRDVEIALIDEALSRQNQARLNVSIIGDVVDEYALAMMDGAIFPALVAFPMSNGTYLLAGGNHRLAAAKEAKITLVDLYLLKVNDEAVQRLITTSLNTLVGLRPDRIELIEHAIAWMERYGRTPKAAAQFYGIPENVLAGELRARSARKRLQLAGVPVTMLSRTAATRLSAIGNDIVLREAAILQSEAGLPEPDLKRLISDVREQRTEAGQLAVVGQWRDRDEVKLRKAQAHKGKGHLDPTTRNRGEIFRGLKIAQNVLERYVSRGQMGLSADVDYEEVLKLARALVSRLEGIGATPR